MRIVAYADDLAVLVSGKRENEIIDKMEYAIVQISEKLKEMKLELATQKTEVIILEGRRKMKNIEINVKQNIIKSVPATKYLGVWLDKDLKMTTHIKKISERAATIQNSLSRIMTKKGNLSQAKRRTLSTVVTSVVL